MPAARTLWHWGPGQAPRPSSTPAPGVFPLLTDPVCRQTFVSGSNKKMSVDLESHRRHLTDLTAAPVNAETVQGVELERLLAGVKPYQRPKPVTNGRPRKAAARTPRTASPPPGGGGGTGA